MIKKIAVSLLSLSFLIGSSPLSCFGREKVADSSNYKIIDAVTGSELKFEKYAKYGTLYLAATAAMKKKILEKEADISKINITLYYAPLYAITDLPEEKWYPQRGERTISSPWLKLTETVSVSGPREIEIRIDATESRFVMDLFSDPYPRLMMDSFFNPNDRTIMTNFLEVDPMSQICLEEAVESYATAVTGGSVRRFSGFSGAFSCVSEPLRRPLLSLFLSSNQTFFAPFIGPVFERLYKTCPDIAPGYYTELYTDLAIQALEILKSESEPEAMWWGEAFRLTHLWERRCQ